MSDSAYPNPQILALAGPVLLLRSWRAEDQWFGLVMIAGWLPCIFAVGVRFHAVTLVLSVLGCMLWVAVGYYVVFQQKWRTGQVSDGFLQGG
jgi:hypothetical protein